MNQPRSTDTRSWLPAAAAGLVLALVVGVGVFAGGGDSSANGDSTDTATVPANTLSGVDQPAAIVAPVTSDTTPAVASVAPLATPLSLGSAGDDVRSLQERLTELGFQPGPADGQFGSGTQQAVWAFKKLIANVAWEEFASETTRR